MIDEYSPDLPESNLVGIDELYSNKTKALEIVPGGFITKVLEDLEVEHNNPFPYKALWRPGTAIVGGAVRDWLDDCLWSRTPRTAPKDIDIVTLNEDAIRIFPRQDDFLVHHVPMKNFSNATTIEDVMATFDFSCNQLAVFRHEHFNRFVLVAGQTTFDDVFNKKLRYVSNGKGTHPIFHLMRIGKFLMRGYSIDTSEVLAIAKTTLGREDTPEDDYDDGVG